MRLMLLPASVTTICGAFIHPRIPHRLPTEAKHYGFRLEPCSTSGATRRQQIAIASSGDQWEKTTYGGGGVAAQANTAVEGGASAMDVRIERSPSPPLDILHRNQDFAYVRMIHMKHLTAAARDYL